MVSLRRSLFLGMFLGLLFALSSCTSPSDPSVPSIPVLEVDDPKAALAVTPYPDAPNEEPITPYPLLSTKTPSPTPAPALWIADYVPNAIVEHVTNELGDQVQIFEEETIASSRLEVHEEMPIAEWVYALVAPFPTIPDSVTLDELQAAWAGELTDGPFTDIPLLMDSETYDTITQLWGEAPSAAVKIVAADEVLQIAWENHPSWAIIPFEGLEPQWKVLQIDDISPIQKDFEAVTYPLTVSFSLTGDTSFLQSLPSILTNRDPAKLTDIMLTGVTALVRGTALTMEGKGVIYPGEDIAPLTKAVDFMHVNNEVPFTPDCPYPNLYPELLVFCSDVSYLELLEYIGTDFVEVSGDHFGDHGSEGTLFTLDLYDEVGLPYYGGGRNLEDGRKPYLIEHNGNKIAILGCNAKGSHYYAPADEVTPGAVPCDYDWMETEITRLNGEGYLVIVTLQHIEYYSYKAQPDLVRDFGRMAEAGAVIVSGSQSHQPHGLSFQNEALIHYGLGNLFFDQYQYCENANCDYGFMDRHIIYDGRHISTELIPIRFIDMARPRPMTSDEKAWFLDMLFEASEW